MLQYVPIYVLAAIDPPKQVLIDLEKLLLNFGGVPLRVLIIGIGCLWIVTVALLSIIVSGIFLFIIILPLLLATSGSVSLLMTTYSPNLCVLNMVILFLF